MIESDSDEENLVDNSGWYAYVRYLAPPCNREIVKVPHIKGYVKIGTHGKKIPWSPRNFDDFNGKMKYAALTRLNQPEGTKPTYWAAQIAAIRGSFDEMKMYLQDERPKFAPKDMLDLSEVDSTEAECDNEDEMEKSPMPLKARDNIQICKVLRSKKDKGKQAAQASLFQSYKTSSVLISDEEPARSSVPPENKSLASTSTLQDDEDSTPVWPPSEQPSDPPVQREESRSSASSQPPHPSVPPVLRVEQLERLLREANLENQRLKARTAENQGFKEMCSKVELLTSKVVDMSKKIESLEDRVSSCGSGKCIPGSAYYSKRDYVQSWLRQLPNITSSASPDGLSCSLITAQDQITFEVGCQFQ